jgi:uncharacterized protein (DUF952 family)
MGIATIYKLMTQPEWDAARAEGVYRGSELDRKDGFIHFSTAAQAEEVARRFFSGVPDLVLLAVDIEMLENLHTPEPEGAGSTLPGTPLVREGQCCGCPSLRWEAASDGQLYPHLYSNLPVAAVTSATPLPLSDGGAPVVPLDLPS